MNMMFRYISINHWIGHGDSQHLTLAPGNPFERLNREQPGFAAHKDCAEKKWIAVGLEWFPQSPKGSLLKQS